MHHLPALIILPALAAALVVPGPRTGDDLEALRLENANLKTENNQLLSKLKKLQGVAVVESSLDDNTQVEAQAHAAEVAKPALGNQSQGSSNKASGSAPRWAAMVISLDRRAERLKRFTKAVSQVEPWLLETKQPESQNGKICRISGRDGQEFASATHSKAFSAWAKAHSKHISSNVHLDVQAKNVADAQVPLSLRDPSSLVLNGWLTSDALAMAASNSSEWPQMTAGAVGLYLGHADAWQRVVRQNLDYAVIFEDDLTLFAPNFQENVTAILATHAGASAWDMLYLQRCNDAAWQKRRTYHDDDEDLTPNDLAGSVTVPIEPHEVVPCTGAYILTRRGAEQLLRGALPARDQLDFQLGKLSNFRRAALSPPVAQCQEVYTNELGEKYRDTDVQQVQSQRQDAGIKALDSMVDKLLDDHRDGGDQQVQSQQQDSATNALGSTAGSLPEKHSGAEAQQVQPQRRDAAIEAHNSGATETLQHRNDANVQQVQPPRRHLKVLNSAADKWLHSSVAKKWLRRWKKVNLFAQLAEGTEISDC